MRQLSLKGRTYPTDLNPGATAFGGWVMAKMDKVASIAVDDIDEHIKVLLERTKN